MHALIIILVSISAIILLSVCCLKGFTTCTFWLVGIIHAIYSKCYNYKKRKKYFTTFFTFGKDKVGVDFVVEQEQVQEQEPHQNLP